VPSYEGCVEQNDSSIQSIEGYLLTTIGIFGLIGNLVSIIILSKKDFKETFHKLIVCLALVDMIFILCAVFVCITKSWQLVGWHSVLVVVIPVGRCALLTSSYLTVSISVERFCGICYPLQSRVRGDRRLVLYLLPVIVFCIIFNLPLFLEIFDHLEIFDLNLQFSNNLLYITIYKQYMELIVTVLVPWLLLLYLNIRIYLAVRLTTIRGRAVHNSVIQKRETNLAVILITIVLVFLCCHSLKLYLAFYKVHVTKKVVSCNETGLVPVHSQLRIFISSLNHLLLVLNSSVNFIIYCFLGKRFRRSLLESVEKMTCYKYDRLSPTSILRTETRNTETSFISKFNQTSRQQHSNISNSLGLH